MNQSLSIWKEKYLEAGKELVTPGMMYQVLGGPRLVLARIGYSEYGMGHSSICLELHELAHGLDLGVFGAISSTHEFKALQERKKRVSLAIM